MRKRTSEDGLDDLTEPISLSGLASVTFDAGGQASFVEPNPVRPILRLEDGGEILVLHWELVEPPVHALSGWDVTFGNVVPCRKLDPLLADLHSESMRDGKRWIWRWPKPAEMPEEILILYDVFFNYHPKTLSPPVQDGRPVQDRKRPLLVQTVSLRQIMSVDPTIILPPKEGGG